MSLFTDSYSRCPDCGELFTGTNAMCWPCENKRLLKRVTMKIGWLCPVCQTVNSPDNRTCVHCDDKREHEMRLAG